MVSNIPAIPNCMGGYNGAMVDPLDYEFGSYSMNGSIFGTMPMMGSPCMGIPFTGGYYNNSQYYDNMSENQRYWVDYNVNQQNMNRNADLRVNASIEAVKGKAAILKDKVLADEQEQIIGAFNDYVDAVRLAYGDGADAEIKARALSLYAQMNGGKTLYQDLRENSHNSFTQGTLQSLTFGLYDNKSCEDNISHISGAPVGRGQKTLHNTGRVVGAGIAGGIAGGIVKALGKGKAGIVGLAVAGVAALASFLTGKVTT